MPQPNIEFWMETRSRARASGTVTPRRSPRKSLKRYADGSPQLSARQSKRHTNGPTFPKPKTQGRNNKKPRAPRQQKCTTVAHQAEATVEVDMFEDRITGSPINSTPEDSPLPQSLLGHADTEMSFEEAESLLGEQYTLGDGSFNEDNTRTPRRHNSIERTDTEILYEHLQQFRKAHERFHEGGGASHPSQVVTTSVDPAPSVPQVPGPAINPGPSKQPRQPFGVLQVVAPAVKPGPSRDPNRPVGPTGTEIVDEEELRRVWELVNAPASTSSSQRQLRPASDSITANTAASLQKFIEEQGLC
ncbi:hypothetical protein CVT25_002502 [Psilocybe cyanescens]|uniref:Uncharacterized protein n=1 Tax=Psilocybe cyanescens TaxID=93625 RepID=A0A409XUQ7_PSICY|nr:hypothetical protein CVT25_002502 [Psilocybe cyanescens]